MRDFLSRLWRRVRGHQPVRFLAECWAAALVVWKYRGLKVGSVAEYADTAMRAAAVCQELRRRNPGRCFGWHSATNHRLDSSGRYVGIHEAVYRDFVSGDGWPITVPVAFGFLPMMEKIPEMGVPDVAPHIQVLVPAAKLAEWKAREVGGDTAFLANLIYHEYHPMLLAEANRLAQKVAEEKAFYASLEDHDDPEEGGRPAGPAVANP